MNGRNVIYGYGLLRNNISIERETFQQRTRILPENHSYLCIVRYPKSTAYGFKIASELEEMRVPKFYSNHWWKLLPMVLTIAERYVINQSAMKGPKAVDL